MFDQITARAPRRGLRITVAVSVFLHAGAVVAALVASVWTIDKLRPKYVAVEWAEPTTPPPPPMATAAPAAPAAVSAKRPVATPAVAVTQPTTTTPTTTTTTTPTVDPGGGGPPGGTDPGGGGTGPGIPGGTGTEPVVAEPPPEKVSIEALAALRISGDPQIRLPPSVLRALADEGVHRADIMVRLCLSASGVPQTVEILKSSGHQQADDQVRDGVRSWRYRPYTVNGRAVPACAAVLMRYEIE
jgi:protein TonB